jgi:hypothetical protein
MKTDLRLYEYKAKGMEEEKDSNDRDTEQMEMKKVQRAYVAMYTMPHQALPPRLISRPKTEQEPIFVRTAAVGHETRLQAQYGGRITKVA